MPRRRLFRDVPGDEFIGDVVEIVADNVRLRPEPQHIIPNAPNESGFPPCRDCAQSVPGMGSDQAKF
jgi:hypothetical protein